MVAAEALGTELEDVLYIVPDTSKTPNTGPTVASRTTMYAAKAVQNACTNLKKTVLDWAETKGLKAASFKELAADYLKEHQELEALGTNIFNDGCSWDEENFTGDAYRGYAITRIHHADNDFARVDHAINGFVALMDRLLKDGKWITTAHPVGSAFVDRLKSKLYPDRFNGI